MSPDAELRLRGEALQWREVEGETVVLDLQGSVYLAVNRSGTALWNALAGGTTRERLVSTLTDAFGVDPATAATEVDDFLATLRERDLLTG